MFLVKRVIGIMCAKNGKNTFKFVTIIREKLCVISDAVDVNSFCR